MAERKSKGAGKRKKKPEVIDVGETPAESSEDEAEKDGDDEAEGEGAEGDGLDADLVAAAGAIDVGDGLDDADTTLDRPVPAPRSSGSLARRDPLGVYMAETRRYPLLTQEEEHDLAVRLVEHGE